MAVITFSDGKSLSLEGPFSGIDVLKAREDLRLYDYVALRVEGKLYDLTRRWSQDLTCALVSKEEPDGLDVLRHDYAHLLAEAVKELFPETQVTIGPSIENGFYYDFYRATPFTPEDFPKIESRMQEIIKRKEAVVREEWSREQAVQFFKDQGEAFKVELIQAIPEGDVLSVYRQGNFVDLCRGPHLPSTGWLGKGFKLTKIAGAYWRGDSKNPMLQRIYGTAWANEADLAAYLTQLEEAEKRDHRRLGKEMQLFHLQEEAPGSVFWHPKGWSLYLAIEAYLRKKLTHHGYQEVRTPQLLDRKLWEASGHWEKFREAMFTCETDAEEVYALKPMNCPCHVQIFRQGLKSYRDLPLRMAEFGSCIRNEPSGALMGLMRVRSFVQDDAHIFCTQGQIVSETQAFCALLREVYQEFGFQDISVRFSDRPERRAGDDALWDKAEEALQAGSEASGLSYTLNPGEGAFYGPKLEFVLKDALGRSWQCGTLQVDFVLPERLGASYVGEDGQKHRPVMLHRAILGSFERFIGILIEHYGGQFPLWLAPVQVAVATITQEADAYGREVFEHLKQRGVRAELDLRNEKITYKIRELSLQKIPMIAVVGKREAEEGTVAIRHFGTAQQEVIPLAALLERFKDQL
ncbi:MAG: threonine--tRNA ligase [Alphaproteobacteria bacterium]